MGRYLGTIKVLGTHVMFMPFYILDYGTLTRLSSQDRYGLFPDSEMLNIKIYNSNEETKKDIERKPKTEWFKTDTATSKGAFYEFRENHGILAKMTGVQDYQLRDEQEKFVTDTVAYHACLNHQIDKNSNFCHICGTSLYNKCPKDGLLSSYSGSFCPSCGRKTTSGNWYSNFEKRYRYYLEYSNKDQPELVEYPYWEYVKHHSMLYNDNMLDLLSSLVYSTAFIDDNDNIYIYLDNGRTAEIVNEHIDTIREILEETDQVLDRKIEVIGDYDIQ